jgi:hypothetical protein
MEGLMFGFYLSPATFPFGLLAPSSHEIRYNPFFGQYTRKSKNIRKQKERRMKGDKYDREWTMTLQGNAQ